VTRVNRLEAGVPRLSAIIITKDEAANIGDCLDTLAFCDERIVVDAASRDGTLLIAKEKGARVATKSFTGFGAQKNYALSLAQGDWVLSIDADERVSPELAREIRAAVEEGRADGYEILRRNSFCGRMMRGSDRVLRLFRRHKGRFTDDVVHERVVCDGIVARLNEPLLHFSVARLEDAIRRIDQYSTLGAEQLVASGRKVSVVNGVTHGIGTFLRVYLLKLGFLDGAAGFMLAVANAEGAYYRYMKAWLARQRD
jgi:glycosyltransferase involved in cell wall biosynthesis